MKQPKIFYFCYDHQTPTGGQKLTYQHVDILNRNGYQAYVMHTKRGFRLNWFENTTRVIDREMFAKLYCRNTDYIVFPEDLGSHILTFPGKKIIFNKNIYYGFNSFGFNKVKRWPDIDKDIKFIITVSSHNERYLKFIFPSTKIRRIYNGIDSERFVYVPLEQKKRMITILPEKATMDNIFLYQALSARAKQNLNRLRNYKWKLINMHTEKEVGKILRETLIFVFLTFHEGFSAMPLEAMLSGAIVVAYKGGPNAEYLNNSNSFLVDSSDNLALIKTVENIAAKFESDREKLEIINQKAYIAARKYSLKREEKSLLKFWQEVFNS